MFEVKKKRCNECLFSSNKIVSDERKKEVLKNIGDNGHFVCHKASIKGKDTCCKGFYDNVKNAKIQMAERFGILDFKD